MKLGRDKIFLYALGAVILLVIAIIIFDPGDYSSKFFKGDSLAIIENKKNIVQVKNSDDLAWRDGELGEKLYKGQLVYTQDDSNVVIKFTKGTIVSAEEKTLIRIEENSDGLLLDLEKGFIDINVGENTNKVFVKNCEAFYHVGQPRSSMS